MGEGQGADLRRSRFNKFPPPSPKYASDHAIKTLFIFSAYTESHTSLVKS